MLEIRTDILFKRSFQLIRSYSSKASSKRWLQRQKADHYTKEAQFQDYKSRAAFKLVQIDDKYDIFKPGQNIVDLGFAPGAWTQVASKRVQPNGNVLGVDIIPANPPPGTSAIQANILSKQTHTLIRNYFLDPKNEIKEQVDDVLNHPSYIEAELRDNPSYTKEDITSKSQFPIDVVLSDMYDPITPAEKFWNNTTNIAFYRMANTSGLVAKDHPASINLCDAALILAIDLLKPRGKFVCKFFAGSLDKGLEKRLRKVFDSVTRDKPDASRRESKENYFVCEGKRSNVDKFEVFNS